MEIPVEWYNDARSTLNPISDSLRMFRELLRIRSLHRDWTGREQGGLEAETKKSPSKLA